MAGNLTRLQQCELLVLKALNDCGLYPDQKAIKPAGVAAIEGVLAPDETETGVVLAEMTLLGLKFYATDLEAGKKFSEHPLFKNYGIRAIGDGNEKDSDVPTEHSAADLLRPGCFVPRAADDRGGTGFAGGEGGDR